MYFHFFRLIQKYSCSFIAIFPLNGGYDNQGNYYTGQERKTLTGAIIDISQDKIFRSAGTLTERDKNLFLFSALPLVGGYVIHKGNKYSVETQSENAEFTGVYQYTLKYVSAFDEEAEDV